MPDFAIEVEGEAAPLSIREVLRVLSSISGANVNHQSLKTSSQQLTNWEKTQGYFSILQDIYSDFSLAEEIRFQAIIQLKNAVDKYWRKTSTNAINKSEKDKIRSNAISTGLYEPRQALNLQNALMVAKIVRYEFPHDWPDVFSIIIQHLRNADSGQVEPAHISNLLTITLQIIKELASGRLQRTKKSLESIASELFAVLGKLYLDLVQKWSSSSTKSVQDMVNSQSALKTLRRLLIAGFEHPHREPLIKQFWLLLQQHQESIWTAWKASNQSKQNEDTHLLIKHLFQYSKLYLDMAKFHPASFVLLDCMDILDRSWAIVSGTDAKEALSIGLDWSVYRNGDLADHDSLIEKLALRALLLFRACIRMVFNPVQTFKYQYPADKEDRKTAVERVRTLVFTDEFVIRLMEILITQYFVLRPQDLRDWEQEPDEWERREEEIVDAWEFSIRSCSEKLFLDLVINFKELLVPRLLQVFHQYATVDNKDVLLKDSLYSAIGIAAACIEDVLDVNGLIQTVLIPEVQLDRPNYNLLRRRTAILLGQWVPIKPDTLDRLAIYQIFTFLLSHNDKLNDHVVRVTAGRQLRLVLEPFEFKFEDFEPYAASILQNLMSLIAETELSETKMALLETVRIAVTKLEGNIEPYAQAILSILPSLWSESGEEHLMKQAILTMITAIITSLGEKGVGYHQGILPLVRDAVQVDSEAIVYLLEEALELWASILHQTPTLNPLPSPELLAMVHDLLPLLEMGSEHLRQCFELIESYTVLSPNTILSPSFCTPLLTSMKGLLNMLSSSRARDASLAPHVLENLIATISTPAHFDENTRSQAVRHLMSNMIDTGYLAEVFSILKQAHDYHQDPRPNRKPPDIIGVGETSLFTLLSRLVILNSSMFLQSVDATGNSLDWLVPEWLGHFDSIGDVIRKKLQVLAITNLLAATTPPPSIMLESLQSLLSIWTDIVVELGDGAADESQGDYLWVGIAAALPDWPGEAPEDARKRAVTNSDPTYVHNVRMFISEQLHHIINFYGGPAAFSQQWFSPIDSAVLSAFAELKIL